MVKESAANSNNIANQPSGPSTLNNGEVTAIPAVKKVAPVVQAAVDNKVDSLEKVADSQYNNLVDNFTIGVWFEKTEQGGTQYRCRLAAIIRACGKYIFVNRAGVKVAEETKASLALQLQEGKLRTLDDGMLFDRALESVITNLRRSK
jgi:hypothetical protein